jgi:hypothetical protein|tara:strand:- start:541 stop:717 length:177 start_codon:yes stop_codon:yes gene_type:complete
MGDISVKNRDWSGAEELKALSEGTRKVSKKKVIPELKALAEGIKKVSKDQKKFSVGKK